MTEKQANEIIRTKYPEATIFKRKSFGGVSSSSLAVVFEPDGKVYGYGGSSYQQVLEKLGFRILYKHNVEAYEERIDRINKEIEAGGYKDFFRGFVTFTNEEIESKKKEIESIRFEIASSIII